MKLNWYRVIVWSIIILGLVVFWFSLFKVIFIKKSTPKLPVSQEAVRIFNCQASPDKDWICNRVVEIADEQKFDNPQLLLEIIYRETQFRNIEGRIDSQDKGYYQISMRYWKNEISEQDAFNLDKATIWTIGKLKKGQLHLWNTFN